MKGAKYDFSGKVAFVTGAATGIGRATAIEFAKNGASVAVVDVNSDDAAWTTKEIERIGGKTTFIKCDVSQADQVKNAVAKTISTFGRIDFAFNNAGIEGAQAMIPDLSEESWDRTISINLKGVWLCLKHLLPVMLKQGSGSIINCSSVAGMIGFQGISAYVASKHAVIGLTKSAALECAKTGVRVNAVCPGVIQTPMIDRFVGGNPEAEKALLASEPIGRAGRPEEVAAAVLWLSSADSSFVTGHALAVDGGWLAT